jgi:hypothetical protein
MKVILLFLTCSPVLLSSQIKVDKSYFEHLLDNKQYERVFQEGNELLKRPYGKTSPLIYYYIGRSLCGSGYISQGRNWYKYIREKFPIERAFRNELELAETTCQINTTTTKTRKIIIINTSYTHSMPGGVRGKSGFTLSCKKDASENYEKLIENDSLEKRLYALTEKQAAVRHLKTFLPARYIIDTSGRFLLVTLNSNQYTEEDIAKATGKLEFAYQYYLSKFNLRESDKLLTVYLMPTRYSLAAAARDVHDIRIPESNIGYSSLKDLSLLGMGKPGNVGTLFHELFHLTIRSDVGDISPWLDEGIASLYSVYKIDNKELTGDVRTWRSMHFNFLMNLKSIETLKVPTLGQLVTYNWEEFQGGSEDNLCRASVNYALSNFFLLFMQQQNVVEKVVEVFKNKSKYTNDPLLPGPDDSSLIQIAFNNDFRNITANFYGWLREQYNIDMPSLLQERGLLRYRDLPIDFQPIFSEVDSLLLAVERTPKLVKKRRLKELRTERATLYDFAHQEYSQLLQKQRAKLQQIANDDMRDSESTIDSTYENDFNDRKVELEGKADAFISKIKQVLSNSRGKKKRP